MTNKMFKTLSICAPCVMAATIIVAPIVVATAKAKPQPEPVPPVPPEPEPVVKSIKLDQFDGKMIYSEFTYIETEDEYIDFDINLYILKTSEVFVPYNFFIIKDSEGVPMEISNLENVLLNGEKVDPQCYVEKDNGFKFVRPIFDIHDDVQLTGRVKITNQVEESKLYRCIWMFN
ncbi:MAG: hypothetical protein KBS35_01225 [Mycoplasma sp.]|nr:hypothetical protein [Candidatus Hennigella equi]